MRSYVIAGRTEVLPVVVVVVVVVAHFRVVCQSRTFHAFHLKIHKLNGNFVEVQTKTTRIKLCYTQISFQT